MAGAGKRRLPAGGSPPAGAALPCGGAMPAGPWLWTSGQIPATCWPRWKTPTSAGPWGRANRPCCPGIGKCWMPWSSPETWTALPLRSGPWHSSTPISISPPARPRLRRRRSGNGAAPSSPSAAGPRRTCCPPCGPLATGSGEHLVKGQGGGANAEPVQRRLTDYNLAQTEAALRKYMRGYFGAPYTTSRSWRAWSGSSAWTSTRAAICTTPPETTPMKSSRAMWPPSGATPCGRWS